MTKVGLIGGGNMGEAVLKGIRKGFSVSVCEPSVARRRYLKKKYRLTAKDLKIVVQSSKVIIVAVKPQNIEGVLKEIRQHLKKNQLVVSIAAGITISYMEKILGKGVKVIRTMPNMPAQIGEGITAISKGSKAKSSDMALATRIFNCVGRTIVVKENLIDAITAVSGSGPAYVFLFAETMINSAQALGLSKKQSEELVMQTLIGSTHLLKQSKDDPATLRAKVTSKGGTTHAALRVFMKHKFPIFFKSALKAAEKRAKELSRR